MRFEQTPAPHAPPLVSVPVVMRRVLLALVPAALCYTWFFGYGLLLNFVLAATGALLTEAGVLRLRGRGTRRALRDYSALVTAALLSFALPPLVPYWIPLLGGGIAILLAKQLFGGLGRNPFNPAMVGYVVLLISFPVEMTQWVPPQMGDIDYRALSFLEQLDYTFLDRLPANVDIDALTRATPLDVVKEGVRSGRSFIEIRGGALFGDFGGRGWEWVANLIVVGGLYLIYAGVIRWHIPVAVLTGLLVPATILSLLDPARYAAPGFHLFSGASMLGAFFIATDPVSAAATVRGRLIYGAGIGLLTYVLRTWGSYPDGVAFAVLLMNAAVPLIDRYTRPRIYGQK
ncbi:MAG TPA: RnfABCDGE type electron transport complex subunit D [Gammaproteobacteria bacterium]|jgi:electron transport complex protein RnfD|nr:RnfABCDGE type electron transport complex subunit D [Gammaproteobacteria bacterium]